MDLPNNPNHKPIIVVRDYDQIDGMYKGCDAKTLSIGLAQYDDSDISLKVFRHSATRWSPQSEELPIHRVLDLSILLLRTLAPEQDFLLQTPISTRMVDLSSANQNKEDILRHCRNDRSNLIPRIEELKYLLNAIDYKTNI